LVRTCVRQIAQAIWAPQRGESVSLPLESLGILHEPAEIVHIYLGTYVLPILIGLHFLGAARHYLTKRQETPADLSSLE
jgi:cytochrome b561